MKQQVREVAEIDWIDNLDGCSKQDAIAWLEDSIADMAILDVEYCVEVER